MVSLTKNLLKTLKISKNFLILHLTQTKQKTMNYSQFLFSQLLSLYDQDFSDLAYDIQFAEAMVLHEKFEQSNFNVDIISEYDCIINYLNNSYNK